MLTTLNTGKIHPVKTKITYRKVLSIDHASLDADIRASCLYSDTHASVDAAVVTNDTSLKELLEKHAPLRTMCVAIRDMNPWINEDILAAKRQRRCFEKLWRKTRLTVHRLAYKEKCDIVKQMIAESKKTYILGKVSDCDGDQKKLFSLTNSLLGRNKVTDLPSSSNHDTLAQSFNEFFINKMSFLTCRLPLIPWITKLCWYF